MVHAGLETLELICENIGIPIQNIIDLNVLIPLVSILMLPKWSFNSIYIKPTPFIIERNERNIEWQLPIWIF